MAMRTVQPLVDLETECDHTAWPLVNLEIECEHTAWQELENLFC